MIFPNFLLEVSKRVLSISEWITSSILTMNSFSSDTAFKTVNIVDNPEPPKPKRGRDICLRICGGSCSQISLSATEKAKRYFARLLKFRHMDFEYARWQMVNIFVSPQKLYRNFSYHSCKYAAYLTSFSSYSKPMGPGRSSIPHPPSTLAFKYVENNLNRI